MTDGRDVIGRNLSSIRAGRNLSRLFWGCTQANESAADIKEIHVKSTMFQTSLNLLIFFCKKNFGSREKNITFAIYF